MNLKQYKPLVLAIRLRLTSSFVKTTEDRPFGFAGQAQIHLILSFANSYWLYLALLSITSSFFRFVATSRSVLTVELIPEARGTVSSISNFAAFLGFALAPIVLGTLYLTQGINGVFLMSMFMLSISVLFVALISDYSPKWAIMRAKLFMNPRSIRLL